MTDALGKQVIPASPRTVLALDEYSGVAMLAAGRRPDHVYATASSATSVAILEAAGVPVDHEPTFLADPDLEKVARDDPDLIVMSQAGPLPSAVESFRRIAPTVTLSYGQGWAASLDETAEIFDAEDRADRVREVLERRIAVLDDALDDDATLSVVMAYDSGLYFPAPSTPMSSLLKEVGLGRPASERRTSSSAAEEQIVSFSAERLGDHDATRMVILSGTSYDSERVRSEPVFGTMPVARRAVDVDGEAWFGNSVFTSWWILDDLESMFVGDLGSASPDDALTRWRSFEEATS